MRSFQGAATIRCHAVFEKGPLLQATAWLLEDGTLETVELDEPWNWSQTQVDVMTRTVRGALFSACVEDWYVIS